MTRWGDMEPIEEPPEWDGEGSMPEPWESEIDDDGVKTVIFYEENNGEISKIKRRVRVEEKTERISKAALRRRGLPKFGAARGADGVERGVTMKADPVYLERSSAKKDKPEVQASEKKYVPGMGLAGKIGVRMREGQDAPEEETQAAATPSGYVAPPLLKTHTVPRGPEL
uniref:Eukaryotic translation initiation factor 3 subunit G N-terminal domain-containing protein n=1 Tax=Palpitomonas bilix TaxID=652834 RepID=A0A7S3D7R5_9EUKA|mmetsp:Transcript_25375/g.63636  ORF Transcript_25375/g.63636 Transcript_25375/m.63636 type:complete len:170 (+) Transcript_25375:132-641(+)